VAQLLNFLLRENEIPLSFAYGHIVVERNIDGAKFIRLIEKEKFYKMDVTDPGDIRLLKQVCSFLKEHHKFDEEKFVQHRNLQQL